MGVRLHYGTASGNYSGAMELPGAATQGTVTGLVEGATYYFAAKAYNSEEKNPGTAPVKAETLPRMLPKLADAGW